MTGPSDKRSSPVIWWSVFNYTGSPKATRHFAHPAIPLWVKCQYCFIVENEVHFVMLPVRFRLFLHWQWAVRKYEGHNLSNRFVLKPTITEILIKSWLWPDRNENLSVNREISISPQYYWERQEILCLVNVWKEICSCCDEIYRCESLLMSVYYFVKVSAWWCLAKTQSR